MSVDVGAAPAPSRPAELKRFYAAYLVSCVGTGMVVPFNTIFLHHVRGYSIGFVSLTLATIALVGIAVNLVTGRLIDRFGPRRTAFAGAALQGVGWAAVGVSPLAAGTLMGAAMIGCGNGLFHSSLTPYFVRVAGQAGLKQVTATRYWIMNVGIGVGAILGGLLSVEHNQLTFLAVYLVNAASFVLLGICMGTADRARGRPDGDRPATETPAARSRSPLRDTTFRLVLAIHVLTVMFGFAQIDSSLPLLVTDRLAQSTLVVGVLSAINTAFVIVAALPLARRLDRAAEPTLIKGAAGLWALAYLFGAAATVADGAARLALLGAFALIFAAGECLLAPALMPVVARLAPAGALGRYSAMMSMLFASAFAVGPTVGMALATGLPVLVYWATLTASALLIIVLARALARRLA